MDSFKETVSEISYMRYLSIFVLLFFAVFLLGCTAQQIPANLLRQASVYNSAQFICENDRTGVETRGYVLLMGLADHTKEGWINEKRYMEQDPKAEFVLIYDQDETRHLPQISEKFLVDMHALLLERPVDELVIFGASAGGVTSSYSIAKLNFSGPIALHTLSSPLRGYNFPDAVLGERSGYLRDIARGLGRFEKPGNNVKVYHHKTVRDTILVDHYCLGVEFLCDAVQIQNNNIEGSKDFFYSDYDHNPLMKVVIPKVLKCYNENLVEIDAAVEGSLGELCTGEEACSVFCHTNRGRCDEYCQNNSENELCAKLFSNQQTTNVDVQRSPPLPQQEENVSQNAAQSVVETQVAEDQPPVLQGLGVSIDRLDRSTNLAGDFIFTNKLIFDDGRVSNNRPFVDFGYVQNSVGGLQENIEYWFYVPLGTKLRAPVSGYVSTPFFNHTQDWGINIMSRQGASWIVSFEHVVNLNVTEGQYINAGDVVAEAAPRSTFNREIAMTELVVWRAGQHITKFCPFSFLNESLKPTYLEKINQLASDWETFVGRDVYSQEQWLEPGCLKQSINET